MPKKPDRELCAVEDKVLAMGEVVEEMIHTATRALMDRDPTAVETLDALEERCDRYQIEIDEDVIRLITVHCPVAQDLRFCVMTARIDTDLERIGDQAINMYQNLELLLSEPAPTHPVDLTHMADLASEMVERSLRAYKEKQAGAAREVIESDDEVDRIYDQISQDVLLSQAGTGKRPVALVLIARALERIADHATNISEEVIYMVHGEDVRHREAVHAGARSED